MEEENVEMTPTYEENDEEVDWGIDYNIDENDALYYQPSLPELGRNISRDAGPRLTRGFSFNMIENNQIEKKQETLIEKIQDTMAVSKAMARAMLLKTQWNVEQLEQKYFDNPETTVKELFNLDWVEVDERMK
jgi:hypothetical protein